MEEQQIQNFVQRVSCDERFRKEVVSDSANVVAREGFSPAVAKAVMSLVPQLSVGEKIGLTTVIPNSYWR